MIIGTLITHRVTLYVTEVGVEQAEIRDIIINTLPVATPLEIQFQEKKKKYQGYFASIGIIAALAISIPLLVLSTDNSTTTSGITILVGFLLVTLIVLLLIELKSIFRQFGETLISYSLGCCWIFLLIPFLCLLPVSLASTDDQAQIRSIAS